jgi:hypothetical protein
MYCSDQCEVSIHQLLAKKENTMIKTIALSAILTAVAGTTAFAQTPSTRTIYAFNVPFEVANAPQPRPQYSAVAQYAQRQAAQAPSSHTFYAYNIPFER